MKLDKNIIWQITVLETLENCDYNVNIDGTTIIISLFLNSFNRINEYKALALQALKSWNMRNFKVV